jgi:hypothetical protein
MGPPVFQQQQPQQPTLADTTPSLPPPPASLPVVNNNNNITVEVSGSKFCIVPSLFQSIEKLNWKKPSNDGVLKLNSDPDVFEMILQYFLFSSLPDSTVLTSKKATELIDLVSSLDPLATQPLLQHVEGIVQTHAKTKKNKTRSRRSSILKRSLSKFPSISSRSNKSSDNNQSNQNTTLKEETMTTASENKEDQQIPTHIDTIHEISPQPPVHLVTATLVKTKTLSKKKKVPSNDYINHQSLGMSDSTSSSDGSISKLSQFTGYSSQIQDENHRADATNINNSTNIHQTTMLPPPSPPSHFIVHPTSYHVHDQASVSEYPQMVTEFDTVQNSVKLPSALLSEKDYNVPQQQPKRGSVKNQSMDGVNQNRLSPGEDSQGKDNRKKAKGLKTSKFIRKVFRNENNDRGQRKMTHADWCASEYVL